MRKKIDLRHFFDGKTTQNNLEINFLFDRKHVAKYIDCFDRSIYFGVFLLAIGSHYFTPADFFDYPSSERFDRDASTEAVAHNLGLLDDFLKSSH